jgi:membrane-associated phospholipid phosphatase
MSVRASHAPWRAVSFVVLLASYVALTLAILRPSALLTLDRQVLDLDVRSRWPGWFPFIHTYVMLGQRAPTILVALPWFVWRAWKTQSARPLVMLATALLVLNLSVGVVKILTGRLGPLRTVDVHAIYHGGSVFPSGHTSNAVVLYGVIAMLAVGHRAVAVSAAAFVSLTVGVSTIYLDTHWLSDVVGGWFAGGLVLLSLPTLLPHAQRLTSAAARVLRRPFQHTSTRAQPVHAPRPPALVHSEITQTAIHAKV